MVDGVADGLSYALVGKLGVGAIEGEHVFVAAVGRGNLVGFGVQRFRKRGVDRGEHVHITAFQGVDRRIVIGQEPQDHVLRDGLV